MVRPLPLPRPRKAPARRLPLGDIPQGWEVTTFGELYNTGSGGTPSRARPEYFEDGTIDWVKSQELLDGFVLSTEERITERALEESSAKLFPANAVLIALYGATIGKLVSQFSERTAPLFDGILTLQRQIQNLRRTRDLLLSRLLSGQGSVAA